MASMNDRLDPNNPNYDPAFAELRRAAYAAFAAHEADMADPNYRRAVARVRQGRKVKFPK